MDKNRSVLIVDDEEDALLSISRALSTHLKDCKIVGASSKEKALKIYSEYKPYCAVVDLELNKKEGVNAGFDLISSLLSLDPDLRILVLTGHSAIEYGIESVRRGASSFIEKPANIHSLSILILDAFNQYELKKASHVLHKSEDELVLQKLSGESEGIRKLKDELLFAASTNQAIFLSGESGVGKGLCASLIHSLSKLKDEKFVRYQPAYISGDLVSSDLFGHKKGSFTGADSDRTGLLDAVGKGSLFLDEIDALPVETQVLFLGVLQEKQFRSVGDTTEKSANFRLISASNAPIEKAVSEGKVRKDFYFRIAHQTIYIPPLRERIKDIPSLSNAMLLAGRVRKDFSVLGINDFSILKLQSYNWPGNIRELQSVVEGAAYRAQFHGRFQIEEDDILFNIKTNSNNINPENIEGDFHTKVTAYKKMLIREALLRNGGNQVRTAKELGLDRSSMRRIIEK